MKERGLAALLVLGAAATCACGGGGGPVGVFEEFAARWANVRPGQEKELAGDELAGRLRSLSMNSLTNGMIVTVIGGDLQVDSTDGEESDGEVAIEATQVIRFNPPGVESAMRATWVAEFTHAAVLAETEAGWKVVEFEPELVEMREID